METVTRNVRDLGANERNAVERLLGHSLRENQQLVIQVVSVDPVTESLPNGSNGGLSPWCNVYEGLTDAEIADIEKSIVRGNECRSFG